ncbi:MAG: DUF1841 family protein [Sterolibacterium sp.]|nr:DUF1841 family protein [Sterolibacterium sp.]MBP9800197.1 DUF1841 family protein [Sterolibacterium sp.]
MFNPSRDQARRYFIDAWRKHLQGLPMSALELTASDTIRLHPEYHDLLNATTQDESELLAREWTPEQGETNPFLHLSLHLALEEQLSIDQPPGIRALLGQLQTRHGERHAALHDLLDCLAETLWHAQRDQRPPDGAAYLECIRRKTR